MRALLILIAAFPLPAQQAVTEQDATKAIDAISGYAARLQPIMEQVKPKEWMEKGAPDTYIAQWNSGMAQLQGLSAVAMALAPHPDRLQDLLPVLFRIQMLEITAGSLGEGLRRYQNPALAELLSGTLAESTPSRETLQRYAIELAAEKDKEFQLVDQEAQRCRGSLTREAPRRAPRSSAPK
ncbi:MAG: hypothetical protein M3Z09_03190 [Acidobacteriota bacterium]|nr:hypothetical protein [Acidobacteriota bacterium]